MSQTKRFKKNKNNLCSFIISQLGLLSSQTWQQSTSMFFNVLRKQLRIPKINLIEYLQCNVGTCGLLAINENENRKKLLEKISSFFFVVALAVYHDYV
jgi:hypothetical protein